MPDADRPAILLVEDDADLRDNLRMLFADAGFRVVAAAGAREAEGFLPGSGAVVVLADYFLGDGNGLEVLRAARHHLPAARCILLTAFGEDHVRSETARREGFEFVRKPFEADEILRLVQGPAR